MKIGLIIQDDYSFWNYRRSIILGLLERGHQVVCLSAPGPYVEKLESVGARHIAIGMERFISPASDLTVLWQLARILRREKFDIVHTFSIKPNLYGTIAAKWSRCPLILNSVTGLGFLYHDGSPQGIRGRLLGRLTWSLFRKTSRWAARTWFQNPDDVEYCVSNRLIRREQAVLVRSSGVNPREWSVEACDPAKTAGIRAELGASPDSPLIVMASRLLISKGIRELQTAARQLLQECPHAKFVLLGQEETGSSDAIDIRELTAPQAPPNFHWLGFRTDVKEILAAADVFTLPSCYREGLPKSLIEAMAMSTPIVTTDHPGCRETVEHGVNGFLVPVKDADALTASLRTLIDDARLRRQMGRAGRRMVMEQFSEEAVVGSLMSRLYGFEERRLRAAA